MASTASFTVERRESTRMASERQRLIHPIILLEDLLAVELSHVLGLGLRDLDEARFADGAFQLAQVAGVADEKVILEAGEELGGAGVALAGGAAVELAIDAAG